jgi:hypothetical protein
MKRLLSAFIVTRQRTVRDDSEQLTAHQGTLIAVPDTFGID